MKKGDHHTALCNSVKVDYKQPEGENTCIVTANEKIVRCWVTTGIHNT